ncbi:MAG: DMT family transporter [Myxococcaceae bacterium]|nr:DMT family transporter [Myxococcaceae bacterium]
MTPPSARPGADTPARVRLHADLVIVFITALWGASFVVVKDAVALADPFSFLALRFALGGAAATAIARRKVLSAEVLRRGAFLGLFLFAGFAFQTTGLVRTTESRSAFITGLSVILVPVVSIALFRRLPKPPSIAAVLIACAGLYVLTGGLKGGGGKSVLEGDLLTLGCAICFAFHIAFTEKFAPRAPALALVAVQLWVVSALACASLPFVEVRVTWTGGFVGALIFAGFFASAMAISLQTWAQARTTAVRAALLFSLEPVFAALMSVGLGREQLGARELVGGGLTVLAVLVADVGNALLARRVREPA